MKDVRKEILVRLSMKRELTPEELSELESEIANDPQARALWEEERALGSALQSLPDVSVSSNFAAQVLAAIDLDEARQRRRVRSWLGVPLPRLGWILGTGTIALVTLVGINHFRTAQFAREFVQISRDLPGPDALQNFEVVNQLRQVPTSDDELLIALQ